MKKNKFWVVKNLKMIGKMIVDHDLIGSLFCTTYLSDCDLIGDHIFPSDCDLIGDHENSDWPQLCELLL